MCVNEKAFEGNGIPDCQEVREARGRDENYLLMYSLSFSREDLR